jgi:uncharacterized membrane protein
VPDPLENRLEALSEALARLVRQQRQIDERMLRVEAAVQLQRPEPAPAPLPVPIIAAPAPPPPILEPAPPPVFAREAEPEPVPAAVPVQRSSTMETQFGLTILNRLGFITLVLAASFGFKWAVDNDWIGPAGRVAIGVLAGLVALGVADFMWRKGQRTFAQGVTALGVAVLYLSIYAAAAYYKLIPFPVAYVCMLSVTVLACALALRYESVAIAALGLAGGYLTPLLLNTGENRPLSLFFYVALLNLGALALVRSRHWRLLEVIALSASLFYYWGWFADKHASSNALPATVGALLFWAIFAFCEWQPLLAVSQISVMLAIGAIWHKSVPNFVLLELLAAAGGLALSYVRRYAILVTVTFVSFWVGYAVWSSNQPTTFDRVSIFLGLTAIFVLFFSWNVWWCLIRREATRSQDLLLLALNGAVYYGASYDLLHVHYSAWMGLLAVAVAGSYLGFGMQLWRQRAVDMRPVLLSAAAALAFLTLAIPIQLSGFAITMAWSVEIAALTWIGLKLNDNRLLWTGLLATALVLVRLLIFDSVMGGQVSPFNQRFLTFLIAGTAALVAAYWSSGRIKEIALSQYISGNIFLLWGMILEVIDWAVRTTPGENQLSVETVAISVLLAVYAVVLVSLGVGTRTAVNRVSGLVLLGIVVLKLYLFDVWQLDRIYKIAAFAALGVLLFATSFLYSRFRGVIENFTKSDT